MAKGQKRSGREPKKPKASKKPAPAPTDSRRWSCFLRQLTSSSPTAARPNSAAHIGGGADWLLPCAGMAPVCGLLLPSLTLSPVFALAGEFAVDRAAGQDSVEDEQHMERERLPITQAAMQRPGGGRRHGCNHR